VAVVMEMRAMRAGQTKHERQGIGPWPKVNAVLDAGAGNHYLRYVPMTEPVRTAPFPFDAATSDRVGCALENALLRHGESREEMRLAIEACVESLWAQGMTPEGVVITMKAMVLHTARTSPRLTRTHSLQAADYFMEDVVKWCAIWYFRER
jgi:hypothetical protein